VQIYGTVGKPTLIVIHGVGDSPPGASLLDLCKGLHGPGVWAERSDVVIQGVTYPSMKLHHPAFSRMIEVNWSDVARPSRLSVFGYFVRIVVTMFVVARQMPAIDTWFARAYQRCFEALLVYCIYPPLLTMLYLTVPHRAGVLTGAIVIAVGGLTLHLTRYGSTLRAGWIWTIAMASEIIGLRLGLVSAQTAVQTTTFFYVASQVVTGSLLFAALVTVALSRSVSVDRRIAGAALLYLPFFSVSAVGALLWALGFALVNGVLKAGDAFRAWQSLYSEVLRDFRYDLALIEFTFAAMVGMVAVGLIGVASRYVSRSRTPVASLDGSAGAAARDGAMYVLAAGGVVFAVLSMVYAVSAATSWRLNWNLSALEVYSISALRFVPYLPLTIGPLATVAGIIVDVLFYVADAKVVSTAVVLADRLRMALDYATSRRWRIVVAAHSQGTVIAADVLGGMPERDTTLLSCFVTAGSPLHSLYERFLGSTLESRAAQSHSFRQPNCWINFSREGDNIGAGQQRQGIVEENLGIGGHTGYWRSAELWQKVTALLGNPT
jgi:hypothetical protein